MKSIQSFIEKLITLREQAQLLHWQTESHATHVTLGSFYANFSTLMDKFVEAYSGKYGKISFGGKLKIELTDESLLSFKGILDEFAIYLVSGISSDSVINEESDKDLRTILDDMLALVNTTKFLLRLK